MDRLPVLSGREVITVLRKVGYLVARQRGSHIRLTCFGKKSVTVPAHKSIDRSLLRKILRDIDLTPEAFMKLTKQ